MNDREPPAPLQKQGRVLQIILSLAAFAAFAALLFAPAAAYYDESFFGLINQKNWLANYAFFEFHLLDFLGISLDLSECSATGTTENLRYVSPKTGKAVCAEAGEPYKDRLFSFPQFIVEQNYEPSPEEIRDLLKMTEFFLQKNFFQTHGLKLPPNRANLLENLEL